MILSPILQTSRNIIIYYIKANYLVKKIDVFCEIIAKYTDFLYNLILGILKLFSPHPISHTTVTVSDTSISSGSISIS